MHIFKRRSRSFFHFLCCLTLTSSMAQDVAQMPKTGGESFAGRKVLLPDDAAGKVAVLIFGFSKASKVPTGAWSSKLLADFGTRPDFELYQLPVLEDVPRFVRGMVIAGIRKGVPENRRAHFVPILQGEPELKKFVHYSEPDDAYLAVLSPAGRVLELSHGTASDANYARMREKIESILTQK